MISLKTHNVLDYVIAAVLVSAPFLFGFAEIMEARYTFLILGFGLALYSMFTKYYYSIAGLIPLGVHMTMDVISGIVLIAAPYALDYRNELTGGQAALHWILGLGAMGLVAVTRQRTERDKTAGQRLETTGSLFADIRRRVHP